MTWHFHIKEEKFERERVLEENSIEENFIGFEMAKEIVINFSLAISWNCHES